MAEDREEKRKLEYDEAFQKFEEDHKDEIEAYEKSLVEEENPKEADYGEEEEEEQAEVKPKEKLVRPEFNIEEHYQKWDDENPVIDIPEEVVDDVDNDWELTEEEEETLLNNYFALQNPA